MVPSIGAGTRMVSLAWMTPERLTSLPKNAAGGLGSVEGVGNGGRIRRRLTAVATPPDVRPCANAKEYCGTACQQPLACHTNKIIARASRRVSGFDSFRSINQRRCSK